MRKLRTLVCFVAFVLSAMTMQAAVGDTFVVNGVTYEVIGDGEVELIEYVNTQDTPNEWVVPDAVINGGTSYEVVSIGYYAVFTKAKSVVIGENVRVIGERAFDGCEMETIRIPISVNQIADKAFASLSKLKKVYVAWNAPVSVVANGGRDAGTFRNTAIGNVTLMVPVGTMSAYNAASTWKDFGMVTDGGTNTFTSTGFWDNTQNWSKGTVPAADEDVIINGIVSVAGSYDVGDIAIQSGGKVILMTGGRLDAGEVSNTAIDRLVFLPSTFGSAIGSLTFSGSAPTATVKLYASGYKAGSTYRWSYVGSPIASTAPASNWFTNTWMCRWDNNVKGSTDLGENWHFMGKTDGFYPFTGYAVTQNTAINYTVTGQLNPAMSKTLALVSSLENNGFNLVANSYSAPIDISEMEITDFTNANAAIYMFDTDAGNYVTVSVGSASDHVIPPMQGFFVQATGSSAKLELDYSRIVVGGDKGNVAMRSKATTDMKELSVRVVGEQGRDVVQLFEGDEFTTDFDNGYDAVKMMGVKEAPQLFSVARDGHMAIHALQDIENVYLGFRAGMGKKYTMCFESVPTDGGVLYLHDLLTQEVIEVVEGEKYEFEAEEGAEATRRFKLVRTPDVLSESLQDVYVSYVDNALRVENYTNEQLDVRVYETTGRLIYADRAEQVGVNYIQLNDVKAGVYMVHVESSEERAAHKIIIE